jgi:hypothetical protein
MLLSTSDLEEILRPLSRFGETFSNISSTRMTLLCAEINSYWSAYVYKNDIYAPNEREKHWKKIESAANKLQNLLGQFGSIGYFFEIIIDPLVHAPPSLADLRQMLPDIKDQDWRSIEKDMKPNLGNFYNLFDSAKQNCEPYLVPQSIIKARIAVANIELIAQRSQKAQAKRKNEPKKKIGRALFIIELSEIYYKFFDLEPTVYRDGPWYIFLPSVLNILEDPQKPMGDEATHSAWVAARKLKKRLSPLTRQQAKGGEFD